MAYIEITSFITRAGVPATDIDDLNPHLDGRNYPRLRIWEIDGGTQDLIIGDPAGSGLNTDAIMSPVIDGVELQMSHEPHSYKETDTQTSEAPTFYICGPMRGIPQFNFPAFDEAAELARAQGLIIINPAEITYNPCHTISI